MYDRVGFSLMSAPLFQNRCLTLYCGVPVKYLLPDGHPPIQEALDFVVCRGQEALAAVILSETALTPQRITEMSDTFQKAGFPPGFLKFVQKDSSAEELFCDHGDHPDWLAQFVIAPSLGLLDNEIPIKSSLCPIPAKLLKALSAPSVKALAKEAQGPQKSWFPTEYGRSLGILQGFRIDKNRCIHPLLCCAKENLGLLQQTVSWGEIRPPEPPKMPLSFSQRIDLINRGIPSDITAMMNQIQRFGEMPLEEYFRNDPKGLKEIRQAFPGARNYQQAAKSLEKLRCQDSYLARILAGPLVRRPDIPFAQQPLRSVLLAASFLTKSRYLVWEGEIIFHDHDFDGVARRWTYRKWMQWIFHHLDRLDSQEDADPNDVCFFGEFICRLAVWPFSMIQNQKAQKSA